MIVDIPGLRLVSELNEHEHYRVRSTRAKRQHDVIDPLLARLGAPPALPVGVIVTRIAPRTLDTGDNLNSCAKWCIDSVAKWLGIDDRDPRLFKHVRQEKGAPKEYGCRIAVVPGAHVCSSCNGVGWIGMHGPVC